MEAKFGAEGEKSFHVVLPKCFVFCILGLSINPLRWAIKKAKGRTCVDSTNGPDPIGSPNHSVPKRLAANANACPPVCHQKYSSRFLLFIWSMREAMPLIEDILLHCDDSDAAFHRVLCHPNLAAVFACIFLEFVVTPLCQVVIVGSCSNPSHFSLMSDV